MGSAMGVCFWWGTSFKQNSCLTLPCVGSLSWTEQITVLVGQDRRWAAATWISNGKQNVWRYSVCGGPAGRRWRLKLGMRVSHPCWYSGTTTLSNSVILVWAESGQLPAKSWGLAVRGRKGFRKPTLTLHQLVTIKGEILTCTVLVWAQWLPYEFS